MSNPNEKPKSKLIDFCIMLSVFLILKILYLTLRKRFIHQERIESLFQEKKLFILAYWHNRIVLSHLGYSEFKPPGRNLCVPVSKSRDGERGSKIIMKLGLDVVRGSSTRGGMKALYDLVKKNREGLDLAFAPDGPKGPIYKVKQGILGAAKVTGAPILPISCIATKKIRLKSWDRLIVPLPFSKVYYIYGNPLHIPKDCSDQDVDVFAETLAHELDSLEEEIILKTGEQSGKKD